MKILIKLNSKQHITSAQAYYRKVTITVLNMIRLIPNAPNHIYGIKLYPWSPALCWKPHCSDYVWIYINKFSRNTLDKKQTCAPSYSYNAYGGHAAAAARQGNDEINTAACPSARHRMTS